MTTAQQLRPLVGNPHAYALQREDGSWMPVREPLTVAVLNRHLSGDITVGTYIGEKLNGQSLAHTLVLDFDSGELEALEEALQAQAALGELGVPEANMGVEFSGRKGYHVWVLLVRPVPNVELRRLGRAALALAGLSMSTEVFPKQDEVKDLGNLVKLPEGRHRVSGKPNVFTDGRVPRPMPVAAWARVVAGLPEEQRAKRSGSADNRFPCLELIQEGVHEGSRNNCLFQLATMFRRHGATDETVGVILDHVNQKGDPLGDFELDNLVDSSRTSGPICDQLPGEMRAACGDLCIRERLAGLQLRAGQVRGASEGEAVVVRVGEHAGDTITFEHDDLASAKGRLRSSHDRR